MITGLYQHRDSAIHRLRPGVKLLALPVAGTTLFLVPSLAGAIAALGIVVLFYPLARLSFRTAWRQLRPVLPVLVLIFLAQLWFADPFVAGLAVIRLAALVLLAALVTLTSRTSYLVGALERAFEPLRPLGADPAKISLAISLTLRFIPLVSAIVAEIREAQAARGIDRSILKLAVPVIVRLLKTSDEIAEAIDARS